VVEAVAAVTTLRIGHPPRLPYRVRARRLLARLARYALAWAIVGWACWAIGDIHLALPGFAIAAMISAPWRPQPRVAPQITSLYSEQTWARLLAPDVLRQPVTQTTGARIHGQGRAGSLSPETG
jgi:hypothetical protein